MERSHGSEDVGATTILTVFAWTGNIGAPPLTPIAAKIRSIPFIRTISGIDASTLSPEFQSITFFHRGGSIESLKTNVIPEGDPPNTEAVGSVLANSTKERAMTGGRPGGGVDGMTIGLGRETPQSAPARAKHICVAKSRQSESSLVYMISAPS